MTRKNITTENFVEAVFANDEQTFVNVRVTEYGDPDRQTEIYVPVDTDNVLYQELMEVTTVDAIEAQTDASRAAESAAIEQVIQRLINEGSIEYTRTLGAQESTNIQAEYDGYMFAYDTENLDHVEKLFNMKLHMFELDEVDAASDALKDSLRTAPDPISAISILHSIRA